MGIDDKEMQNGAEFLDILKQKFRKLALKYHPDRSKLEYAAMKMKRLNAAYDCLQVI